MSRSTDRGSRARLPFPSPSDVLTPTVAMLTAGVFVALGLLAAFADGNLLSWDEPVRDAVRRVDGWGEAVLRWGSNLGSRGLIPTLMVPAVALAWSRCRQIALVLVFAFVAALGIELLLKELVARPRPVGARGFGHSFPSGHVLAATAFWGLVPPWAYLMTRRKWLWVLAVVASTASLVIVGASRIYVGAHWPSDVVGGYLSGAIFLLIAEWGVRRPFPRLGCEACEFHPFRDVVAEVQHLEIPHRSRVGA